MELIFRNKNFFQAIHYQPKYTKLKSDIYYKSNPRKYHSNNIKFKFSTKLYKNWEIITIKICR